MGKESSSATQITPEHVEAYLKTKGFADAHVVALRPLGVNQQEGLKSYGYGRPLRVTFSSGGQTFDWVLRTMSPDPFGHQRRADRADVLFQAYDSFNQVPRHIRTFDLGAFAPGGELVSIPTGEIFLTTEYVEGELYAKDLHQRASEGSASPVDLERAEALALYLADLHSEKVDPTLYSRSVRDVIGSGEGIFGLCDSYPQDDTKLTERLKRFEIAMVHWRWRMRAYSQRARRTHGDFHPFNILFRLGSDFSVLDASRGIAGEPADDCTCLSVNYLFFALQYQDGKFEGAMRQIWDRFWKVYLDTTGDRDLLKVVAPFFLWRVLVLASPVWYPQVKNEIRNKLLRFAERLADGSSFDPANIDQLLT